MRDTDISVPGAGETDRERFTRIDRAAVGGPPDGFESWDDYRAAARKSKERVNEPGIQESIRATEERISREAKEDTIAYFATKAAEVRKQMRKLQEYIDHIGEIIAKDPDLYRGVDISLSEKLDEAQRELNRCLAHIIQARGNDDSKVRGKQREVDANGSGAPR